jgi:hypothetical protein
MRAGGSALLYRCGVRQQVDLPVLLGSELKNGTALAHGAISEQSRSHAAVI